MARIEKQDILNHVDIVEYISEIVELKPENGMDFKGLCPFHKETTPSFHVRRAQQYFKCFGCGVGGDIFAFTMLMARCGFAEAIERLARWANLERAKIEARSAISQTVYPGIVPQEGVQTISNFDYVVSEYEKALDKNPDVLKPLNISREVAKRLSIGWDGASLNFPMRNAEGKIVGIRRRFPDGRKSSVRGGREGVFLPHGNDPKGVLFIMEGATDTACAVSLGLDAVGRPSCQGGGQILAELVVGKHVCIIPDSDNAGMMGAESLGILLVPYCASMTVMYPKFQAKDFRDWVERAGLTKGIVLNAYEELYTKCRSQGKESLSPTDRINTNSPATVPTLYKTTSPTWTVALNNAIATTTNTTTNITW